ncbi:unnamed protein product [Ixodes pacificus]
MITSEKQIQQKAQQKMFRRNLYMQVLETGSKGLLDKIGILKWPLLLMAYAYTVHTTINVFLTFMRIHNMMKVLDIAGYAARSFFACLNLRQAFQISTPSNRLLQRLSFGENQRRCFEVSTFLKVFVLVYFVVEVSLSIDFVLNGDIGEYVTSFLYGTNISTTNMTQEVIKAATFFNLTLFDILSIVPGLLMADYIAACLRLRRLLASFRTTVMDGRVKKTVTCTEVKRYQDLSYDAWRELKRIDDIYTTVVFLWYLDIIINLVLSMRNLSKGISSRQFALDSAYYIVIFVTLSLSASSVDTEAKDLMQEVKQLRSNIDEDDWQTGGQILLLETGLQSSRIVLNSGHFCVIDRPFILGVVGAIATYTILVVQLTPPG